MTFSSFLSASVYGSAVSKYDRNNVLSFIKQSAITGALYFTRVSQAARMAA